MAKTKRPKPKAKAPSSVPHRPKVPRDTITMSITPRIHRPGIYPLGWRKPTDKEAVEQAMDHLRQLMRDPYYYEAMLRLLRAGDFVDKPSGVLPYEAGKLAGKLQRPQTPSTPGKRGHPLNKELDAVRSFAELIREWNAQGKIKMPLREFFRRIVKKEYPNVPIEQREQFSRKFYEQVRQFLRPKRRKVTFSTKNPLPSWTPVPTFNRKSLSAKFRAR